MSWAKENKFLTGYIVVMVIGAGALGYQVFSANAAYDDAMEKYKQKAGAYNTMRHLTPYPNRDNLAKLEAQKKEAEEVVKTFQKDLAKRGFPLEQVSPADFQETLRKTVNAVRTKATAASVELGKDPKEKFYLGFQRYETAPPDVAAAPLLGRDLKAIEWVVNQIIETPVIAIREIKRPELPEERKGTTAGRATPVPRGAPAGTPKPSLVNAHTFEVVFNCQQPQLAKILNKIISPDAPQFFIPRGVKVVNSAQKPPSKKTEGGLGAVAPLPPGATPVPTTPDPNAAAVPATPAPSSTTIAYLLGQETIEATVRLDIVDFAEPPAVTTPAASPAPAR
jgi:hypothetical protein